MSQVHFPLSFRFPLFVFSVTISDAHRCVLAREQDLARNLGGRWSPLETPCKLSYQLKIHEGRFTKLPSRRILRRHQLDFAGSPEEGRSAGISFRTEKSADPGSLLPKGVTDREPLGFARVVR